MTIAACYLSSEGVVFGADSTYTSTVPGPGDPIGADHHYNFAQKILQIGCGGTLGVAMWGLGTLVGVSHRTLIAQFADQLQAAPPGSMRDVADRWAAFFWTAYNVHLAAIVQEVQMLSGLPNRSQEDEQRLVHLADIYSGGFCLGGCLSGDRTPHAFEIVYGPNQASPPVATELPMGTAYFWGCQSIVERLLFGVDPGLLRSILQSGSWNGSEQDLMDLVAPFQIHQPFDLPIREAIDWVYTSIYTTNQAMKFSHLPPVCGGPVEVAVITTDRPFRWVRHKRLDAAITPSGSSDGF